MMLLKWLKISLLGFVLALPATGYAAVDMFLKIDGVEGESQDDKNRGAIDVLAWSWGASTAITGRTSRCNIQDVSLTKYIDSASPDLLMAQLEGQFYRTARLSVRKAGFNPLEYIVIEFFDVRITSVSTGGSGGEDRLTENVTFNFGSANYTYTQQTRDGGMGQQKSATIGGC